MYLLIASAVMCIIVAALFTYDPSETKRTKLIVWLLVIIILMLITRIITFIN